MASVMHTQVTLRLFLIVCETGMNGQGWLIGVQRYMGVIVAITLQSYKSSIAY